jgi:hypothetical protein
VVVRLTPFLERPNLDLEVQDELGDRLASATVVEATESELTLTLHLDSRSPSPLTLVTSVSYREHGAVDRRETSVAAAAE